MNYTTWSKSSRILLQHFSKWKVDVNYLLCICKHILYGLLIGFNKIFITKLQIFKPGYMGFLNYNTKCIIFDIDISNYEADYTKTSRFLITWCSSRVLEVSKMAVIKISLIDIFSSYKILLMIYFLIYRNLLEFIIFVQSYFHYL